MNFDEPIKFSAPDYGDSELDAVAEVIRSGWIVGGAKLQKLEDIVAARCGTRHAIGVTSWTTAGFLTLYAWGVGPGDEVIVPSYTFVATPNVVRHVGAQPIFADVDPHTWNLDPVDVEKKVTSRTKVIIPVDQVGLPCDMDGLNAIAKEHGLMVLQDAACALGSIYKGRQVGGQADAAAFSLHARKIVTTGEGGVIVTDDNVLAKKLRVLRHQGASVSDVERHGGPSTTFEEYLEVGFNFRLTDIQASIGVEQLRRLDSMIDKRDEIARRYDEAFSDHPSINLPRTLENCRSNWQSYMIGIDQSASVTRDELMSELDRRGIPSRRGVMASHMEPVYRESQASLPTTERLAKENFLLPMHNHLKPEQQQAVVSTVVQVLAS